MNRRRFLALFGIVAAKPKLLIPPPTKLVRFTYAPQVSSILPSPENLIGTTITYHADFIPDTLGSDEIEIGII